MAVHFVDNELACWDELEADALVLTFFSDERPLRGAAGLADWRLCGLFSRLIKYKRLSGDRGEALLLPPRRRLPFRRILLFGLGRSGRFDDNRYREHVRWIRGVILRAGVGAYAVQPPGRATDMIGARRALELWLEQVDRDGRSQDPITIIDHRGGQKEMADLLRYRGHPL